jgi:hypothetical protein
MLDDHDFGGLDQRSNGLALLKAHFTDRVGGNNGRNMLATASFGNTRGACPDLPWRENGC